MQRTFQKSGFGDNKNTQQYQIIRTETEYFQDSGRGASIRNLHFALAKCKDDKREDKIHRE
jgi:hypothetical protein